MAEPENERLPFIESVKLGVDIAKHMTTLSTGSLLVLGTFLDKFSQNVKTFQPLLISALMLVLCLILMSTYLTNAVFYFHSDDRERYERRRTHFMVILAVGFTSFVLAMGQIVVFIFQNIHKLSTVTSQSRS